MLRPMYMGILTSNDQYITIEDSTSYFGIIEINGTAINIYNYFEVSVDASCPTGYLPEFSLKLYTHGWKLSLSNIS